MPVRLKDTTLMRRSLLAGTAVGLLLSVTPAWAQKGAVVVVTPRTDSGAISAQGTQQVIQELGASLAQRVTQIDAIGADLQACQTKAGQVPAAPPQARLNAKAACEVSHAAAKRDFYQSLQPVLFAAEITFRVEAERVGTEAERLAIQIAAATREEAQAKQAAEAVSAAFAPQLATFDPDHLDRDQDARIRETLRILTLTDIAQQAAAVKRAGLDRKQKFLVENKNKFQDWSHGFGQSARDIDVGVAYETARLGTLANNAEWAVISDATIGIPGSLTSLAGTAAAISSFLRADPSAGVDPVAMPAGTLPSYPQGASSPYASLVEIFRARGLSVGTKVTR
jgi:hypothetical protein